VKASRFGRPHSGAAHYSHLSDVDVRREARVDLRDLQQQIKGEFHAFMNGRIVRGFTFYANPPLPEDFQLIVHEMLQVLPPSREQLDQRHGAPKRIAERLAALVREEQRLELEGVPPATLAAPIAVLRDPRGLDRMETAMSAVCHWIDTYRSSIQTPPPTASDSAGADVADEHGHDDGVPVGPRQSAPNHRNRDREDAQGSDLHLAFSGMPEVPPGPYGGGLSADEIVEAAARAAREITAGLAVDVMHIEQALGQDPHSAAQIGNAFAEQIAQGLEYPVIPVPEKEPETEERLRQAIRRLVRGITPGPSRDEI
jgi:hypothetical protein